MLSFLATAALILAPSVTGYPTAGVADTANISAPNRICVSFCEDVYFEGHCQQLCNSPGLCQILLAPLRRQVSAVRPAEDASGCTFFSGPSCNGDDLEDVTSPGIADLTTNGWNDRIQSWLCY